MEKKESWRESGQWFRKFYDPKDLEKRTKIITAFEPNGSRIKRLLKAERIDVDGALLKSFKQRRSDNLPFNSLLLITIFVFPEF